MAKSWFHCQVEVATTMIGGSQLGHQQRSNGNNESSHHSSNSSTTNIFGKQKPHHGNKNDDIDLETGIGEEKLGQSLKQQHSSDSNSSLASIQENGRRLATSQNAVYRWYRLFLFVVCVACTGGLVLGYSVLKKGEKVLKIQYFEVALIGFMASLALIMLIHICLRWLSARRAYSLLPDSELRDPGGSNLGRRNSNFRIGDSFDERFSAITELIGTEQRWFDKITAQRIGDILTSFENMENLVRFKLMLDSHIRHQGSSLYRLVYYDLPTEVKEDILEHIERVNETSSKSHARVQRRVFVISDMDDTLVSTFKDMRYPFNTVYPGVRQFYQELVRSVPPPYGTLNDHLTFVTARPSWLNIWTHADLRRHGFGTCVALTGSSISFITPAQMLGRKVRQCSQMKALYPEGIFYLVGDNGQKDIDLGRELLKRDLVKGVFIHDIFEPVSYGEPELVHTESKDTTWVDQPMNHLESNASMEARGLTTPDSELEIPSVIHPKQVPRQTSEGTFRVLQSTPNGYRNEECNEAGIVLFQSYTGAACFAMQQGHMSLQALLNVATASAEDFSKIKFTTKAQKLRQRQVFLRDIARISHCLHHDPHEAVTFLKTVHSHLDKP